MQTDNYGFCKYQGHQQFMVQFICTYKQCSMARLCCYQCLSDGIHDHPNNQNHLMNQEEFLNKLKTDKEKLQNDFLNNQEAIYLEHFLWQLLKELQKLKTLIIKLEQNAKEYIDTLTCKNDIMHLQLLINQLEGPELTYPQNKDINKWLNINYKYFNYKVQPLQDRLNIIQQQLNKVLQNVTDYQEQKHDYKNFRLRKYDIQQILWKKNNCEQAIISSIDQYLVFIYGNTINILDIKLNKVCQQIYFRNRLCSLKFTFDYQYLFAGDDKGFVYGLFVQNGFKNFYKQQIHQDQIQQIKIIQTSIITCSRDGAIIKTDFIKKQQIFKLVGDGDSIISFDYNESKDIICVLDYSIKIWDCQNQSIIIDQRGDCLQAQFIDNKQNLLLLDDQGNLLKYKIDYLNKQLVKLDEYQDNNKIFRFQQINDDQLLLICQQYCKILNKEKLIGTIHHFLQFQSYKYQIIADSSDNLKYIVLNDEGNLYLAKALN